MMRITSYNCNFEREPLIKPFGFKGGNLTELWQTVVRFKDDKGNSCTGLGLQSVLWSDNQIFFSNPEASGNAIMFQITAFAAKAAVGIEWNTPLELLEKILPQAHEYGKAISSSQNLRLTFVLNALVPVDNAAWQLYANNNPGRLFDELLDDATRSALNMRHDTLASVPLISYGVDEAEIRKLLNNGICLLKIKIGSDPDSDGSKEKMVEWDKQRFSMIHRIAKNYRTEYTENGRIMYYLDANSRYDSKERVMDFLDHAKQIEALDLILILEEPFPEECLNDVSEIPVPIAADESAHSDTHAEERIQAGYSIIALKPIAKTMSMSLKIAELAHRKGVQCFCADLTVNPTMVEWNKMVASRLPSLKGMKVGILETNGAQNYKNWETMLSWNPGYGKQWAEENQGIFKLDKEFYNENAGIFIEPSHYSSLATI